MKDKIFNVLKLIGIYSIIYILFSVLFVYLFSTKIFNSMHVLMYRGMFFIIITGVLSAAAMCIIKAVSKTKIIEIKDIILMFCGFCCVNVVLFTMVPVTVERSVSVFMLSYMYENDDITYTEDDMAEIFVDKYVNQYGAFEKRFDEQVVSGNIEENGNGTYSITDNGREIVEMFRIVAKWFDTDERLVYPNEN